MEVRMTQLEWKTASTCNSERSKCGMSGEVEEIAKTRRLHYQAIKIYKSDNSSGRWAISH